MHRISSDLRSEPGVGAVSTRVGDHLGILRAVVFVIFGVVKLVCAEFDHRLIKDTAFLFCWKSESDAVAKIINAILFVFAPTRLSGGPWTIWEYCVL